MAQELPDLGKRRALAQQLARGSVPEAMGGYLADASALAGRDHDLRDSARRHRAVRRLDANERRPAIGISRTPPVQIVGQRLPDIDRQR